MFKSSVVWPVNEKLPGAYPDFEGQLPHPRGKEKRGQKRGKDERKRRKEGPPPSPIWFLIEENINYFQNNSLIYAHILF